MLPGITSKSSTEKVPNFWIPYNLKLDVSIEKNLLREKQSQMDDAEFNGKQQHSNSFVSQN